MKTKLQFTILFFLSVLAACGGGSSGPSASAASLGLMEVAGNYELQASTCSGAFDDQVTVTQSGSSVTVTPNDEDNFLSASGTLYADDTFTLSNANGDCTGDVYINGFVYIECDLDGEECSASYMKE